MFPFALTIALAVLEVLFAAAVIRIWLRRGPQGRKMLLSLREYALAPVLFLLFLTARSGLQQELTSRLLLLLISLVCAYTQIWVSLKDQKASSRRERIFPALFDLLPCLTLLLLQASLSASLRRILCTIVLLMFAFARILRLWLSCRSLPPAD